ncbi:MAG: hypothetical protein JWN98_1449, partial [Abditibacteriota bacterium]|nr:hypothetical protein [Abditibacteriota bacterium]
MMNPMKYMTRCTLAGALVVTIAAPQMVRAQAAATAPATAVTAPGEEKFGQGVLFPFSLLDVAVDRRISKDSEVNYTQLKGDKNLDKFVRAVATADLKRFPVFTSMPKVPEGKAPKPEDLKPIEDRSWELVFWVN